MRRAGLWREGLKNSSFILITCLPRLTTTNTMVYGYLAGYDTMMITKKSEKHLVSPLYNLMTPRTRPKPSYTIAV